MFKIFLQKTKLTRNQSEVKKIVEKKLNENRAVIESLRDYDEGKKDISTTAVERDLRWAKHHVVSL